MTTTTTAACVGSAAGRTATTHNHHTCPPPTFHVHTYPPFELRRNVSGTIDAEGSDGPGWNRERARAGAKEPASADRSRTVGQPASRPRRMRGTPSSPSFFLPSRHFLQPFFCMIFGFLFYGQKPTWVENRGRRLILQRVKTGTADGKVEAAIEKRRWGRWRHRADEARGLGTLCGVFFFSTRFGRALGLEASACILSVRRRRGFALRCFSRRG
jgi:hypothetical protein